MVRSGSLMNSVQSEKRTWLFGLSGWPHGTIVTGLTQDGKSTRTWREALKDVPTSQDGRQDTYLPTKDLEDPIVALFRPEEDP